MATDPTAGHRSGGEKRAAWGMMAVVILLACNMRAPFTGVGALTALIQSDLALNHAAMGMLTTIPMMVFAVVSLTATPLAERIGLGRSLVLALLLVLGGELIRSFTTAVGVFVGTAVLCMGVGLENVLVVSLIKLRFPHNPAPPTSAYSTTMALTSCISIGSGLWLAQTLGLGWRGALAAWGVLAAAALAVWFPLSSRPENQLARQEGEKGCTLRLLRTPRTWELMVFMGSQSMLFYCLTAWGPTILQAKGFTLEQSAAAATFLQLVSLPITLAAPLLTRRFPVRRMLMLLNSLFLAGVVIYYLGNSLPVCYLGMLLLAQGMGSQFSFCLLFYSLRTRTAAQASALSGLAQCGGYLLAAVGPVLMGWLADSTGSWDLPMVFLIAALLVMWAASLRSAREGYILPEE